MKLKLIVVGGCIATVLCSGWQACEAMKTAETSNLKSPADVMDALNKASVSDLNAILDALKDTNMKTQPGYQQAVNAYKRKKTKLMGTGNGLTKKNEIVDKIGQITEDSINSKDAATLKFLFNLAKMPVKDTDQPEVLSCLHLCKSKTAKPVTTDPDFRKSELRNGLQLDLFNDKHERLMKILLKSDLNPDDPHFVTDTSTSYDVDIAGKTDTNVHNTFINRLIKERVKP